MIYVIHFFCGSQTLKPARVCVSLFCYFDFPKKRQNHDTAGASRKRLKNLSLNDHSHFRNRMWWEWQHCHNHFHPTGLTRTVVQNTKLAGGINHIMYIAYDIRVYIILYMYVSYINMSYIHMFIDISGLIVTTIHTYHIYIYTSLG